VRLKAWPCVDETDMYALESLDSNSATRAA
jgi:hypothetical protein